VIGRKIGDSGRRNRNGNPILINTRSKVSIRI
jgi:hypothetical protein